MKTIVMGALLVAACGGDDGGPEVVAPPSVADGVFFAFQGGPPPGPGSPTPFVWVGCPGDDGAVEVQFYALAEDGTVDDVGLRVGAWTRDGIADAIVFDEAPGDSLALREENSLAESPFVYAATVTIDPAFLDVGAHTFVARMLNPAMPDLDDLGIYFTERLVACVVP